VRSKGGKNFQSHQRGSAAQPWQSQLQFSVQVPKEAVGIRAAMGTTLVLSGIHMTGEAYEFSSGARQRVVASN